MLEETDISEKFKRLLVTIGFRGNLENNENNTILVLPCWKY